MSNITFMIGNGFDLACGLKSRYTDTYDEYIKRSSSSNTIEQFKKTIDKDIPTWSDFEMQLASYALNLESESDLTACLRDYDEFLNDYLVNEQHQFWTNLGNIATEEIILQEMGKSVVRFYNGLTRNDFRSIHSIVKNSEIRYNFISFNYTNIFDSFLERAYNHGHLDPNQGFPFSVASVLHIHGALGSDVTLGVDNEEQLAKIPYSLSNRAKRVLIKPVFLQSYDNNRFNTAIETISRSDIICVFGMSLGDSDLIWRKQLAEWLVSEKEHHLVYYKHSNMMKRYHSTALTKKMDDEEDSKEELISLLFDETIEGEMKNKVFSKIHVPVGINLFNMEQAINEAYEREQRKTELAKRVSAVNK